MIPRLDGVQKTHVGGAIPRVVLSWRIPQAGNVHLRNTWEPLKGVKKINVAGGEFCEGTGRHTSVGKVELWIES